MPDSAFIFGDNGRPVTIEDGNFTQDRVYSSYSNNLWTGLQLDRRNILTNEINGEIEAELPIPTDGEVHYMSVSTSANFSQDDTIQFYDEDRSFNGINHGQWTRLSGSGLISMWVYNQVRETWLKF